MTLQETINAVQKALTAAVNEAPIKDVSFTDQYTPKGYPGVNFMLTGLATNDDDQFPFDFKAWDMSYDVTVFSRSDYATAVSVVNEVYDKLMDEKIRRLSGTCSDLNIDSIEYGYVSIGIDNPEVMSGGVIKLIIKIFEQR